MNCLSHPNLSREATKLFTVATAKNFAALALLP
jgi:hypothetical protein